LIGEINIQEGEVKNDESLVAIVVVTYNRLSLLKECIESLKDQTRKADTIIIVNNGSKDGTKEWLASQTGIIVIEQEMNIGSAGGFYVGMKYAVERNCDWIWVMDDDAAPVQNCLEKMAACFPLENAAVALAPLVKEDGSLINNHRSNLIMRPDLSGFQIRLPAGRELEPQVIQFASFVGIMVNKKLTDDCGLPDNNLFFQNDDVEYCLRINKSGKIFLVPDAVIEHKFVKKHIEEKKRRLGIFKVNDFTLNLIFIKFFVQRNKILIKRKYFLENSSVRYYLFYINVVLNYFKNLLKIFFLVPFRYKKIYFNLYTTAYSQGLKGKPKNEDVLELWEKERQKQQSQKVTA
jgi:rhamnopyranosyl-N-acetylglucosaminyl-diphospho-decaprenol beta-1,3/1,4-galactofuranosyltransferase